MGLFRNDESIQIEYMFQNPNWQEANQLVMYKRGQGFDLETTKSKSS